MIANYHENDHMTDTYINYGHVNIFMLFVFIHSLFDKIFLPDENDLISLNTFQRICKLLFNVLE